MPTITFLSRSICGSVTWAFRDRAPRIVKDNATGKERVIIEEHTSDARLSIGRVGAVEARQGLIEPDAMAYKDGEPGGFDLRYLPIERTLRSQAIAASASRI
jgi:hypothetical protein